MNQICLYSIMGHGKTKFKGESTETGGRTQLLVTDSVPVHSKQLFSFWFHSLPSQVLLASGTHNALAEIVSCHQIHGRNLNVPVLWIRLCFWIPQFYPKPCFWKTLFIITPVWVKSLKVGISHSLGVFNHPLLLQSSSLSTLWHQVEYTC